MLGKLARQHDPKVLVGFDQADDAGVYQISPDTALVQTVDFFTPIVDDPYTFGQIAATNSLSDVYAMGGRPLTALALVCFPEKGDLTILEQILSGGLSKMMEASCTVVGGHSIRDEETKFGYSVTGLIHPQKVFANAGAKPGDHLILTKALGTGVISTAIKKEQARQSWIEAAVASMTTLNKTAAEVVTGHLNPRNQINKNHVGTAASAVLASEASEKIAGAREQSSHSNTQADPTATSQSASPFAVHAITDITGFGLIGHSRELALASKVSLKIISSRIPALEGALDCIRAGQIPGGLKANREFAECVVSYDPGIPEEIKTLLFDPQTAGGLLIAVAAEHATQLTQALKSAGVPAHTIGEVLPPAKPLITVTI